MAPWLPLKFVIKETAVIYSQLYLNGVDIILGTKFLNLSHPVGKSLFQLNCLNWLNDGEGRISRAEIGLIKDALEDLPFGHFSSWDVVDKDLHKKLHTNLEEICQLVEKNKAVAEIAHNIRNAIPEIEDFVPGTYATKRISQWHQNSRRYQENQDEVQEFGDVLN